MRGNSAVWHHPLAERARQRLDSPLGVHILVASLSSFPNRCTRDKTCCSKMGLSACLFDTEQSLQKPGRFRASFRKKGILRKRTVCNVKTHPERVYVHRVAKVQEGGDDSRFSRAESLSSGKSIRVCVASPVVAVRLLQHSAG